MKERPILFSGEMVRAILDGRKTQTRRKMKPRPPSGVPEGVYCDPYNGNFEHFTFWTQDDKMCNGLIGNVKIKGNPTCHWKCPYGVPGDRLWVRETWREPEDHEGFEGGVVIYAASEMDAAVKWKPSIHMPRYASRITLEIVNVKVERLHDIGADDCRQEGIEPPVMTGCHGSATAEDIKKLLDIGWRWAYQHVWNNINRPGSWEKNPWVWVVEFKRIS